MKKKVIIIGAGMAGCFMAVCLAKHGYDVEIYEHRPDVRQEPYDSGRSFNLTLYYRGIQAMKKAGIWDEVKKIAIIAQGNAAHYGEKKIVYDAFDGIGDEILYTVHRNQLNGALLDGAEQFSNVTIIFNTKCVGLDAKKKKVYFEKVTKEKSTKKALDTFSVTTDMVVGADGIHSTVRAEIRPDKKDTAVKEYEAWGYKEVHVSPELTKTLQLRPKATHTWPRPDSLLIAFPNPDNSFTLMFNLPLEGKGSFAQLTDKDRITKYIQNDFPDLAPLIPHIIHSFLNKPTGKFVTLFSDTWHDRDFIVMIGDGAHAVIPFYGQGVCAAFEDCLVFADLVDMYHGDSAKIFPEYQKRRKINTDLLAQLSKENFLELRDKSRSPYHIFKDKADTLLHRIFPKFWLPPLYVLIAHGNLEYKDALMLHKKQLQLSRKIGLDAVLYALALPWFITNKYKNKDAFRGL